MAEKKEPDFKSLGVPGLSIWSGILREEWLSELQGKKGRKVWREMRDNDSTVGSILFAISHILRGAQWSVEPGGDSRADREAADFLEQCMYDMETPWTEFISEVQSFLVYGFAVFEILWKVREGPDAPPSGRSKYSDKRIGWRDFSIRAQETIDRWDMDSSGHLKGLWQVAPPDYKQRYIPADKFLLFRTEAHKGNPEGRALDPETPIPTPDGWKKLDDIQPGDKVFDENGRICYVVAREDWENRPCYKLVFNDGTSIIADVNHLWATQKLWERSKGLPPRLRTTEEIVRTLKNSNGVSNHSIPWPGTLDYPKQFLLLHPYFLGLWLADGSSRCAQIACHADDLEEQMTLLQECGYAVKARVNGRAEGKGREIMVQGDERWARNCPQALLGVLGLLENKHIPEAYLRSSVEDRKELLAGLMDGDGYVDKWGRCEFVNRNENLARGVAELVRSLGVSAYVSTYVNDHGNKTWKVKFTPPWSPFKLSRKVKRTINERARQNYYIVDAEKVPNRRTVCIQVSSPSGMFLAGESMIPTHNSILRNCYLSWYFKKNLQILEGIGAERDLAGLPVLYVPYDYLTDPDKEKDRAWLQDLVENIRQDEEAGLLLPMDPYAEGGPRELMRLELISSAGSKQFETSEIIQRYDHAIAQTVLADFVLLGLESKGSYALAREKRTVFETALIAWLDSIADTINAKAVRQLFEFNDFGIDNPPKLVARLPRVPDLDEVTKLIDALSRAGAELFPDEDLENALRTQVGLPAKKREA